MLAEILGAPFTQWRLLKIVYTGVFIYLSPPTRYTKGYSNIPWCDVEWLLVRNITLNYWCIGLCLCLRDVCSTLAFPCKQGKRIKSWPQRFYGDRDTMSGTVFFQGWVFKQVGRQPAPPSQLDREASFMRTTFLLYFQNKSAWCILLKAPQLDGLKQIVLTVFTLSKLYLKQYLKQSIRYC